MKAEIGRPGTIVATGGLASLFDEQSDLFDAIEADPTIQGLAIVHSGAKPPAKVQVPRLPQYSIA